MPDIEALNIININIHSTDTEQAGDGDNYYTNKPIAQKEDMKQETKRAEKCYRDTRHLSNLTTKISPMVNNQ